MSIMSMDPSEFEETDQIFCNSHFNSFEFDGWIEDHSLNIYNFDSDGDTYFHRVNLASPEQDRNQLCTVFLDCSEFDTTALNARCTKCQALIKEDSNGLTVCPKCFAKESKSNSKLRVRNQRSYKTNRNGVKNVESNNKPYQCKYCDEYFGGISSLLDHVKLHSNVRCEVCGRSFCNEVELKAHSKCHCDASISKKRRRTSYESSFSTDYDANSSFNSAEIGETSSNISAKLEVDTDGACRTCGMSGAMYTRKSSHVCTTAEMSSIRKTFEETTDDGISNPRREDVPSRYTCAYCNKAFNQVLEFNAHMMTHNTLNRFQCKFCDQRFRKSCLLLSHVQTAHQWVQ